ncbi:MAG TPA: hypothetical protein PLV62_03865 [Spirochaetota bacterium]|nr:hypothetical protein [Spirochaetota bacterium]HPK44097.1 hypothetical protein [Spirochaetota bacterium]HQG42543.1 hypothetical protein [Spirochaetota bacterium]HRR60104.1 hypothetical protein [Spirochaetota bacterium]
MEITDTINYYVEPVEIEIYLKKAGKVRTIIKDMFVELIDVEPLPNETSKKIFEHFKSNNQPIDLIEITNLFPELISMVFESYYHNINLYEKLSLYFKAGLSGSTDSWRLALYFTELLMKFEPTIASSQYIGDFQTYNLNYLIRKLNQLGEKFLLEDATVLYLIKRRNKAYEGKPRDKEFEKLVELWQFNVKEHPF